MWNVKAVPIVFGVLMFGIGVDCTAQAPSGSVAQNQLLPPGKDPTQVPDFPMADGTRKAIKLFDAGSASQRHYGAHRHGDRSCAAQAQEAGARSEGAAAHQSYSRAPHRPLPNVPPIVELCAERMLL
jgi:hypothetical protein